jgi:hypothetical protein
MMAVSVTYLQYQPRRGYAVLVQSCPDLVKQVLVQ